MTNNACSVQTLVIWIPHVLLFLMVDQGRKLIENGGFYVNDTKIMDYKAKVQNKIRKLDDRITVVRTGNKQMVTCVLEFLFNKY